jgi:alpha-N-arabinofuranosidase
VILTNKEKLVLTPTYHVMEMYNVHQDAVLLPVMTSSNEYVYGNQRLPAISASASRDKNGVTHISLVNIDAKKMQEVSIDIRGAVYKTISGRVVSSATLQDHNSFDSPEKIKPVAFNNFKKSDNQVSVSMPPFSVVVLELK